MAGDWADDLRPGAITRRRTLQILGLAGGAAVVASLAVSVKSLLPPPIACRGEVSGRFYYAQTDPGLHPWWEPLINQPAKITDFPLWFGASTVWLAVIGDDGRPEAGCGVPALVIRVDENLLQVGDNPFNFQAFIAKKTLPTANGMEQFTIVAFFDRCVHLCCKPGWHETPVPPSWKADYVPEPPRTFLATPLPQDPIFCNCHGSQYDPVTLLLNKHPNGVKYVGANRVHLPAPRGLPAIPLKLAQQGSDYFLEGIYQPADGGHPEWYSSYCH